MQVLTEIKGRSSGRAHVVSICVCGQVDDPLGLVGALLHGLCAWVVVLEVLQCHLACMALLHID